MKIGEKIRKAIIASPYSVSEIANKLNTTNQNLYRIFKKDTIETKYLEKISNILNIDISVFFEDTKEIEVVNKKDSNLMLKLKNENKAQKEQINILNDELLLLKAQLKDKEKIIVLLEEYMKILKETGAISSYNLTTPKEKKGLTYPNFNNVDELIREVDENSFDFNSEEEKWKYLKKIAEERIREKS